MHIPKRKLEYDQSRESIPEAFHTVTSHLAVRGAGQAVDFYKRAFGAEELMRMAGPDGKSIRHAELRIGDVRISLNDGSPDMGCCSPQSLGGTASSLHLYVEDVDAAFKRAVEAGATVRMPVADMFWGDRYGKLVDPFGHEWGMATHKEDLMPEEIRKQAEAFFAQITNPQQ